MIRLVTLSVIILLTACNKADTTKDKEIDKLFGHLELQKDFDKEVLQGIDLMLKGNMSLVSYRSDLHDFALENLGWKAMGPKIRNIYKQNFSVEELQDLNDFFKTKTGKRFSKIGPQITMDIVNLAQNTAQEKIPEFFKQLKNRRPANNEDADKPILEKMGN